MTTYSLSRLARLPAPYENATTVLCACNCDTCSNGHSATIVLLVVLSLNLLLVVLLLLVPAALLCCCCDFPFADFDWLRSC